MSEIRLDGKVAVVTGSGRGLGLAFAQSLAAAGASVVINDIDAEVAQAAVDAIRSAGGQAVAEVVPVGNAAAADRLVERAVSSYGRLDILCANAGILRDRVLWNMSDDDFDQVIGTHLRGTFTCARAAVRRMRTQGSGGRLILVSSIAGQRGNFGQTNYSAAKAGIAALARTWALECARSDIQVNAVVPVALTRMLASIPGLEKQVEMSERGGPILPGLRRLGLGSPADVASLVVFLSSDHARSVTGQCIGIGGDKLSLWSHPQEIQTAFRDGGWTAEAIAQTWSTSIGRELQSFGDDLPKHLAEVIPPGDVAP
ncbi:SDR family NAD(P)-dependent oxidoreductase [Azohydromonas lata]|uniref:SDR family NAD(P)-dependent oxidoreductase n=1 Tax=Azohydromonas lata TaxID=45677 RepID=UPI00082CAD28|nr:SDR family oxidoreductase [Azohydromonas lata]